MRFVLHCNYLILIITEIKSYKSFERAMKFSADDVHVWTQQALCLEAAGRHVKALEVLTQVICMQPSAVVPCLLAARICYQHLFKVCFINHISCANKLYTK